MKHIKIFESFVNEELSPELKKRTYDAMMKIAKDPNAIDSDMKFQQAKNVQDSLSPEVEKLRKELQEHARNSFAKTKFSPVTLSSLIKTEVSMFDMGLSGKYSEEDGGYLRLYVEIPNHRNILYLLICKDRYEKFNRGSLQDEIIFVESSGNEVSRRHLEEILYADRAFVNTLKKLIVQIQKDEIPGDEPVPAQPQSITKEGEIVLFPLTR
jgi:hypothetical protein